MSRVLKFRIWDKANKEYKILGATGLDARNGDVIDYYNEGNRLGGPEEYDVEQCTGLKDKNGKEIYEGDIIKARDWDGDWGKYRIKWKPSHCAFEAFECRKHGRWNWTLQGFGGIEVIGNIHENKELLGESD